MSDSRAALRLSYARWLRLRANVRALAMPLIAAQHALRRDARGAADPDVTTLAEHLAVQQRAIEDLAADLEARIAQIKSDCAVLDAGYVAEVVSAARRGRR